MKYVRNGVVIPTQKVSEQASMVKRTLNDGKLKKCVAANQKLLIRWSQCAPFFSTGVF